MGDIRRLKTSGGCVFFVIHEVEGLPGQGLLVNFSRVRQVRIFEELWKDRRVEGGREEKRGKKEE